MGEVYVMTNGIKRSCRTLLSLFSSALILTLVAIIIVRWSPFVVIVVIIFYRQKKSSKYCSTKFFKRAILMRIDAD